MSLVCSMKSYHPEFQKWPPGLVVGHWGLEWMMYVKSWAQGSGQSAAPGHSVQVQVCSMPGYSENQFFFGPQSNSMVGQTQGLSQPGDLIASSTNTQRKSLVKIRKSIIRTDDWIIECLLLLLFNYCIYFLKATLNSLENKDTNNRTIIQGICDAYKG